MLRRQAGIASDHSLPVEEPWFLISNLAHDLDLVWSYEKRFCCEQLFRDQKSGVFRLTGSGLREPQRIDQLLLVVAIAVLAGSLQGYALSLSGLRRQVDPHWKRGMSFLRIGLAALQMAVADAAARLMDWPPIPPLGAGALYPQSQGQEKAGAGLVLND